MTQTNNSRKLQFNGDELSCGVAESVIIKMNAFVVILTILYC